jgi:5-hydroxyisourate hydrolase-like protein (transthyretin family)
MNHEQLTDSVINLAADSRQLRETLNRIESQTLARIEEKVTETNGRVRTLEVWKARAQGAWMVVSLMGPVITGLIVKFV